MDRERRRQLKALGKLEVERRSAELHTGLTAANPNPIGSEEWARGYRTGTLRERWLRRKLPILHAKRLNKLFAVTPEPGEGWVPHLGGYLLCLECGSAVPSAIRRKLFYWGSCACGNVRWRCFLFWRCSHVEDWQRLAPVRLLGRA